MQEKEVTMSKGLEECISSLDSSLHCHLKAGHKSTVVLSVYLRKEKSYTERLGSFQPVLLLFSPTRHYKFKVFIYHTLEERTIDGIRLFHLPLPKLVIWDICGSCMEKIWDELWSIYGICMALIWAIAFHIKPILGHCFFLVHILLSSPMGLLRIS